MAKKTKKTATKKTAKKAATKVPKGQGVIDQKLTQEPSASGGVAITGAPGRG
jgi:hypothetical protein